MKTFTNKKTKKTENAIIKRKDIRLLDQKNIDRVFFLILFFGALLLYGWTYSFDFSLDDGYVTDSLIKADKSFSGLLSVFTQPFGGEDYRPISILTFWIQQLLFGSVEPGVAHLINVFIFGLILVSIYKFIIVCRFNEDINKVRWIAFLTAVIFLIHPNHVSVVANIKSRDGLLSMLFGLLSAIEFIKYYDDKKRKRILSVILLLALGFLSKMDCYVFALIPAVIIAFFRQTDYKRIAMLFFFSFLLFGIVFLIKDGLDSNLINPNNKLIGTREFAENPLYENDTWSNKVSLSLVSMLYYLKFLVIPFGYYFYYGYNQIPFVPITDKLPLLSLTLYILIVLASIYLFRKNRIYLFSFIFFLIGIAYAANLFMIVNGILMDRYAFIASLGFCLALAALLIDIRKSKVGEKISNICIPLIAIILVYFTVFRTAAWKDKETLFRTDIPHLEKSAFANRIMASFLANKVNNEKMNPTDKIKLSEEALYYFNQSLNIYPGYMDVYYDLGAFYVSVLNEPKKALEYFKRVDESKDSTLNKKELYKLMAFCYLSMNDSPNAIKSFYKDVISNPNDLDKFRNLILIFTNKKEIKNAMSLCQRLISLNTKLPEVYFSSGNLYMYNKDSLNAVKSYKKAVELGFNPQLNQRIQQLETGLRYRSNN